MARPEVLVLRAPGTNCDLETAFAFEQAGARADALHVNAVLESPGLLRRYQVLCVAGGFSHGDDLSAGQILAVTLRHRLIDELRDFRDRGGLVLGICNGFQVLIKTGLLDNEDSAGVAATLTWNTNGRYSADWVRLAVEPHPRCVFLRGIEAIDLPFAHGEGRFVVRDEAALDQLTQAGQLPLRYVEGQLAGNPNGSTQAIAGMCDRSGRVFGLMPHPERNIHLTHHPRWTRLSRDRKPDGQLIFENAVSWFAA